MAGGGFLFFISLERGNPGAAEGRSNEWSESSRKMGGNRDRCRRQRRSSIQCYALLKKFRMKGDCEGERGECEGEAKMEVVFLNAFLGRICIDFLPSLR